VIVTGTMTVDRSYPTARTNCIDTQFNPDFINGMPQKQVTGICLHETLHKVLKHTFRHENYWAEDEEIMGASADYVVNSVIRNLQGYGDWIELPKGHLYEAQFDGWSLGEVYRFLRKGKPQNPPPPEEGDGEPQDGEGSGGGGAPEGDEEGEDEPQEGEDEPQEGEGKVTVDGQDYSTQTSDQHDRGKAESMTREEIEEHSKAIDQAIQQGGIMAGRFGIDMPRAITQMLTPKIDWKEAMRDFVSNVIKGRDEFTFKRYNRRHLADDLYLPTTESETVGGIVNASDTSGSITQEILDKQATELASCCELLQPDWVRQVWWDTEVHGEQIFKQEDYAQIAKLLKPQGGGGTHAGCVSTYLIEHKIEPECVIVMTDGYTEQPIEWKHTAPVLWLVTDNKDFQCPAGHKMVMMED
jgi:predicted metal-dependent peptidase